MSENGQGGPAVISVDEWERRYGRNSPPLASEHGDIELRQWALETAAEHCRETGESNVVKVALEFYNFALGRISEEHVRDLAADD